MASEFPPRDGFPAEQEHVGAVFSDGAPVIFINPDADLLSLSGEQLATEVIAASNAVVDYYHTLSPEQRRTVHLASDLSTVHEVTNMPPLADLLNSDTQ